MNPRKIPGLAESVTLIDVWTFYGQRYSMKKIRIMLFIVSSWCLHALSFLIPRRDDIWVFVGWYKNSERETFADNAKYLFLHVANEHKEIRAIWIGGEDAICELLRAKGYEAYSTHSLRGAYYSLRAGHTIIDAIMQTVTWRYCGGSHVTQLWHADGIKSLFLGRKPNRADWGKLFKTPGFFKRAHTYIASSRYIAEHFTGPSFNVAKDNIEITGLPRYDIFFNEVPGYEIDAHTKLAADIEAVKSAGAKKVIMYGPTFRRGKTPAEQLAHLSLPELNSFLAAREFYLFISLHPKFAASNWRPGEEFSHIRFLNAEFDIYPYLKEFDQLITDYSSTCLEFLLLDKPTIFYVYDFDQYKKDPGIPEQFWNLVPGPRVKTFAELCSALSAPDTMQSQRMQVRKILFEFTPGTASENVAQAIENNTF